MNWKQKRAAAIKAAQELLAKVRGENRELADDERAELDRHLAVKAQADQIEADEAKYADILGVAGEGVEDEGEDAGRKDGAKPKAKSLGEHWAMELQEKGYKSAAEIPAGATVAASEVLVKAATDTHLVGDAEGAFGPLVTEVDESFAMPKRERLVIADLLGSGRTRKSTIKYPVFGILEGGPDWVAEGGAKSQMHVADPTWRDDSMAEVAGFFKVSDIMAEDLPYMVSEINSTAAYELLLREEQALLFGDGTGNSLVGITERSGVQTATQGVDTAADAIFKALGLVHSATGFVADGIVINPTDYEALRLNKDGNGQYFGGGYFAGQYGSGQIMSDPPVWGRRTVVTTAVPAGTVIVGAWRTARLFPKGGIRVESTNSHADDFTNDLITTRLRKRELLQVKHPSAFVVLTLA